MLLGPCNRKMPNQRNYKSQSLRYLTVINHIFCDIFFEFIRTDVLPKSQKKGSYPTRHWDFDEKRSILGHIALLSIHENVFTSIWYLL